jgi:hypothetical protein
LLTVVLIEVAPGAIKALAQDAAVKALQELRQFAPDWAKGLVEPLLDGVQQEL